MFAECVCCACNEGVSGGFVITNFISFLVGLCASWVFWKIQLTLQPDLQTSKFVIYNSNAKTFKIKVKNEGRRDVVDITAKFRISQRKRGTKSGEYFIAQLVNLSESPPFRNVLAPEKNDEPWGLLNASVFESDSSEEALDLLQEDVPGVERRLVVDVSSIDAESGSKKISRLTYSIDNVVFDKQFSRGLTIDESISSELN